MDIKGKYENAVDKDKDVDNDKDVDYNEKDVDETMMSCSNMEKNNTNDQEVEYVDENDETVNLETDQNCKTGMCVMWNTEVNLEDPMIIRSGKQVSYEA
ncbi:hypothetical protein DPMN_012293 [Dreissena polymorpha]|uniref:Uncharacterized protein n=1 Tax=Dreissena polymorpha TaxID=45954 RepID=A0A9D4N593_DREPO|nr:hypothetical protein DPMN_012293 [Dreissena polymorpha]